MGGSGARRRRLSGRRRSPQQRGPIAAERGSPRPGAVCSMPCPHPATNHVCNSQGNRIGKRASGYHAGTECPLPKTSPSVEEIYELHGDVIVVSHLEAVSEPLGVQCGGVVASQRSCLCPERGLQAARLEHLSRAHAHPPTGSVDRSGNGCLCPPPPTLSSGPTPAAAGGTRSREAVRLDRQAVRLACAARVLPRALRCGRARFPSLPPFRPPTTCPSCL